MADTEGRDPAPDFELASVPAFDRGRRAMDCFATVGVRTSSLAWTTSGIDLWAGRSLRRDRRLGPPGASATSSPATSVGGPWLIRTYERGVEGETLACGTGTVASGVALAARGESPLTVRFTSRGGEELQVRADLSGRSASEVWLGGQGKLVFRAVWEG
jgi:diaminopimelate epimerase